MCDTYIGAKEHLRAKSYSLTNLVSMQLGVNREDIEYEKISQYFSNAEDLEKMLRHSDFDTYLCAELMFSLQLLPLSRQLTTLSGNLWSMTLTAGRAVRNEYLLLHEFHRNKYICPDKSYYKDNKDAPIIVGGDMDDQDEPAAAKKGSKRKPQYAGGLVLEPKKGFYDKFVLLLDFNSLYPSIIQEYNICFTTVKHDKEKVNISTFTLHLKASIALHYLIGCISRCIYSIRRTTMTPFLTIQNQRCQQEFFPNFLPTLLSADEKSRSS